MNICHYITRYREYKNIFDDILKYIFRLHVTDEYNEAVYARVHIFLDYLMNIG
jgi:hypothetical protein